MTLEGLSLAEVAQRIMACEDCPLSRGRTHAVPGEGAERATIMFIGEAPGWHEDQQGRPFVGPAGQFLDELLPVAKLKRPKVFITNMVKCRPPGNRDPLPNEIEACRKYLELQVELIQPRVIVCLGRHALSRFFPGETIGKVHGTWRRGNSRIFFAMYHPAAALHQQGLRKIIQEDFLKLPQAVDEVEKAGETQSLIQQLRLF